MISASHARKIGPERGINPNDIALRKMVEELNICIADASTNSQTSVEFFCMEPMMNSNNPWVVIHALMRHATDRGYKIDILAPHLLRFSWGTHATEKPMSDRRIQKAVGPPPESPFVSSPPPIGLPRSAIAPSNALFALKAKETMRGSVVPPPLPPKMQQEQNERDARTAAATPAVTATPGSARKKKQRVRIVASS